VAELIQQRPGPLIALGDIAYPSGTLDQFHNCFAQPYAKIINRIIPVVGNHEYETPDAQGWKEFFNQDDTYYSQALSPDWLLIVVDTECNLIGGCGPDDPQQKWLTQTLAIAPKCVVVAAHRPYRTSQLDYDRQPRTEHIHNIITSHNADIFLTGHAHIYEHINHGTTQQFTIGTGGAGLRGFGDRVPGSTSALSEHGALHMTLTPTGYTWEFLNTKGTLMDAGTNTCN
jgi:predicted phosphodiesterase